PFLGTRTWTTSMPSSAKSHPSITAFSTPRSRFITLLMDATLMTALLDSGQAQFCGLLVASATFQALGWPTIMSGGPFFRGELGAGRGAPSAVPGAPGDARTRARRRGLRPRGPALPRGGSPRSAGPLPARLDGVLRAQGKP